MICAVGTALLPLAVQIASFPAPVAVTAFTLIAVTLFQSLRRHRRARVRHRYARNPAQCPAVSRRDLTAYLPEPDSPARPAAPEQAGKSCHRGPVSGDTAARLAGHLGQAQAAHRHPALPSGPSPALPNARGVQKSASRLCRGKLPADIG